ncbi:MAG: LD-carboxypeptidase [Betaproteobacteria bacterium]
MSASRRRFGFTLAALATAGAAGIVPAVACAATAVVQAAARAGAHGTRRTRTLVKPPRLAARSVVGLIAPGGVVDDAIIETCVSHLESLGFSVKPGKNLRAAHGGYAGTVSERLDDLHAMFADREVKAIWTARGGSGCTALLPHLRYGFIRNHPKILIGYSDITALHLALFRQAGLITFHGPVAWSTFSSYSVEHMLAVLMAPAPHYAMPMAIENAEKAATQPNYAMRSLHDGVAEGRLIGGNLSLVAALAGTPYAADFRHRLLFLEDVGEPPYRIDRMLTQLDQEFGLRHAAGAMLGIFQKTTVPDREPSVTFAEVIDDHFGELSIPAVYGWSFGHVAHQMTIPVGVRARMDTAKGTLTLLEPAVA